MDTATTRARRVLRAVAAISMPLLLPCVATLVVPLAAAAGGPVRGRVATDPQVPSVTTTRCAPIVHAWGLGFGGPNDFGQAVAAQASGDAVLAGAAAGPLDLGGGVLAPVTGQDLFLAGFDASGHHQWSRRFGNGGGARLAIDSNRNVVLAGYISGTSDFGGGPLVCLGTNDIVLAKFDAGGRHLWSKRFGDDNAFPNFQMAQAVAVDGAGNVFIAGSLGGAVDFGGGARTGSVFLAKFGPAGNHLWSRGFDSELYYPSLAVDPHGDVYMASEGRGVVNMGSGPLSGPGGLDIVVAKFDPAGAPLWSRVYGDVNNDSPTDIAVDGDGNVMVTGYFSGTMAFDGGSLSAAANYDLFLFKLDPGAHLIWAREFTGQAAPYATVLLPRLGVDPAGDVILADGVSGSVDFGCGPLTVPSSAVNYTVLAEFDRNGNAIASQAYGVGSNGAFNLACALAPGGGAILTGEFNGSVDFGGGVINSSDSRASYIAKLSLPNQPPDCAHAMASPATLLVPDHEFVPIEILGVVDPDGDPVALRVTRVSQDEPLGSADGDDDDRDGLLASAQGGTTVPADPQGRRWGGHHGRGGCQDARINPSGGVAVRAEREGSGNGRVYTISFTASDGRGGMSDGSVQVCVPRARHGRHDEAAPTCVDDGHAFNSLGPCAGDHGHDHDVPAASLLTTGATIGGPSALQYALPSASAVSIELFDVAGRLVAKLDQGLREAGTHEASWDTRGVARGMYFCRLNAGSRAAATSVLIVR